MSRSTRDQCESVLMLLCNSVSTEVEKTDSGGFASVALPSASNAM